MKAFIVVSCLLAVASAGVLHHAPLAYSARAAVVDQNGYKIDEVGAYNALPLAAPWAAPVIAARTYAAPIAAPIAAPVAYAADFKWAGPQHLPVIGPNGVPLDTPEVAAGKVANAHFHAEAKARNGDLAVVAPVVGPVASPVIAARTVAAPLAVATYASHHVPVIGPNGVPLDTPEVAHAKAVHYEAHVDAKLRNGDLGLVHYRKRRGIIAAPHAYSHAAPLAYSHAALAKTAVFDQNGYKIDEVAAPLAAPIVHAAPVLAARTIAAQIAAPIAAPVAYAADYKWVGPQHLPVIGPNGVPLDTPEVAAGKVANAVAHVEAKARNGDLGIVAPVAPIAAPVIAARTIAGAIATPLATPLAYAAPYYGYAGPQHLPVIGPNGVPLDTPEVAAGKVANAVAHVEAKARNGDLYYHY